MSLDVDSKRRRATRVKKDIDIGQATSLPSGYASSDLPRVNDLLLSLLDPEKVAAKIPTTTLIKTTTVPVLWQGDVTGQSSYLFVLSFFRNDYEQFQVWKNVGTPTLPVWIHMQTINPSRKIGESYSFDRFVSGFFTVRSSTISSGVFTVQGRVTGVYASDFFNFSNYTSSQLLPLSIDDQSVVPSHTVADGMVVVSDPCNNQGYEPVVSSNVQPLGEALTQINYTSDQPNSPVWFAATLPTSLLFTTNLSLGLPFGLVETTKIDTQVQFQVVRTIGSAAHQIQPVLEVLYAYEGAIVAISQRIPANWDNALSTFPPTRAWVEVREHYDEKLKRMVKTNSRRIPWDRRELNWWQKVKSRCIIVADDEGSELDSDSDFKELNNKKKGGIKENDRNAMLQRAEKKVIEELKDSKKLLVDEVNIYLAAGSLVFYTPTPITSIAINLFNVNTDAPYSTNTFNGFFGDITISNWAYSTQGSLSPVGLVMVENVDTSQEITVTGRINYEARPNTNLVKDMKMTYDPNSILEDIDWAKSVISNKVMFGIRNVYKYSEFAEKQKTNYFVDLSVRQTHIGMAWSLRGMLRSGSDYIRRAIPIASTVGNAFADFLSRAASAGEISID